MPTVGGVIVTVAVFLMNANMAAKPRIDSAIFTCGYALFAHEEVAMLFPPSDISVNDMHNISTAESVHRRSVGTFCKQLKTYSSCVKDNLFDLPVDDLVRIYMNIDNFDKIFGFYCRNSLLIMEQFHCTMISVLRNRCPFGGVYGLIAQVSQMIRHPIGNEEFCMNIRQSIECRINKQLSPCHLKFADVMAWIYTSLVGNYCRLVV